MEFVFIIVIVGAVVSGISLFTVDPIWIVGVAVAAVVLANFRWWRVAQREHYLPGYVSLFVVRWWWNRPLNIILLFSALFGLVIGQIFESALIIPSLILALGPIGLSIRGRSSKLAWTARMKRIAAVTVIAQIVVGLLFAFVVSLPTFGCVMLAILAPNFVEFALIATRKYENRLASGFVLKAKKRLSTVSPEVVAITGSYGKTSTKIAIAHLLSGSKTVVASPASFNNRAGVSRTINEHLTPGTDVLVLEMGTYGEGEIAELCDIAPPDISVFTAIGPVHLERFGSEAAIIAAKAEIFEDASVAVLNIDDDRLARLADRLEQAGKSVWRCSTGVDAHVVLQSGELRIDGEVVAQDVAGGVPGNLACAVAVALAAGVSAEVVAERIGNVPPVSHRKEVTTNDKGVVVIDDTFNLNPAAAREGLKTLAEIPQGARKVLVTPGMVELGKRQFEENKQFAMAAADVATVIIIVGRTNRRALVQGVEAKGKEPVILVPNLSKAVDWVRSHTEAGDAVLYANDLPDHYA